MKPQNVIRHVAVVAAEGVARPGRDEPVPVRQIDHPAHLGTERRLPVHGIVVVARRPIRPHTVQEPQGAIGWASFQTLSDR